MRITIATRIFLALTVASLVIQTIHAVVTRDGQSHEMVFAPDREYHTIFPDEILVE